MIVAPTEIERIVALEVQVKDVHDDVHDVREAVREIAKALSGRPQWSVVFMLSGLLAACSAMGTALIAR